MKYKQYAIAIALLLADSVQAGPNSVKTSQSKSVKNLVQQSSAGQEGRLSDQLKDLSSKLPETRVLEHKLEKMVTLEPAIANALSGINKITEAPNQPDLRMQGKETKKMVEEIEKYTDGRQGITKFTDKMNSEKDDAIKQINSYANELNGSDKSTLFDDLETKPEKKSGSKTEEKEVEKEVKKEESKVDAIKELKEEATKEEGKTGSIKEKVKAVAKKAAKEEAGVEEAKEVVHEAVIPVVVNQMSQKMKVKVSAEKATKEEEKKVEEKEEDTEKPKKKESGAADLASKIDTIEKEEKLETAPEPKKENKEEIASAVTQAIENVNETENKKEKKSSEAEMQKEVEEEAETLVEKARLKATQKIKKSVVKQESMSDGIISMVSDNLARKAKVETDQDEMRAKIESVVQTRAVSSDAKIAATRDSLQAGFDATREPLPTTMKEIEASAHNPILSLAQKQKK